MKGRKWVWAGMALAGLLLPGRTIAAQRTTETSTRTPTLTKADVIWTDLSCRIKAYEVTFPITIGGITVPEKTLEIPNGGSGLSSGAHFNVYISNKGTRGATFQTKIEAWKPPGPWKLFDPKTGVELPPSAYTSSVRLESNETKLLGPFYLKPTFGKHSFVLQLAADGINAVDESDEANNTCRISVILVGATAP